MKKIHDIQTAAQLLKSGAVLAHPTDTCFGLTGDLMNPKTLEKIQRIKGRDAKKPMSIFLKAFRGQGSGVSEKSAIQNFAKPSDYAKKICEKLLPGPVTIVLPKGPQIPTWYFPETEWIGIRMVDDENVNELLEAFGGPLITTSANLSGQPACYTTQEVEKAFEGRNEKPDGILPPSVRTRLIASLQIPPSTVIKIVDEEIEVLRKGPVSI